MDIKKGTKLKIYHKRHVGIYYLVEDQFMPD